MTLLLLPATTSPLQRRRACPLLASRRGAQLRVLQHGGSSIGAYTGPANAAEFNEITERLGGHQHHIYTELHKRYGDIMLLGEDVVGTDIVTLFHPDDIESVMRHEGPLPRGRDRHCSPSRNFTASTRQRASTLTIDGEKWLDLRKKMNKPMMSPRAAKSYLPPSPRDAQVLKHLEGTAMPCLIMCRV